MFNGPTSKPQLFDPQFLEPIQLKSSKTKAINQQLQELKDNYKNKVLDPMQDTFFAFKENLWVYFLVEPKKVLYAIKKISEHAAKTSSKCVGLKCKPT